MPSNVVISYGNFMNQILFNPESPDTITLTLKPAFGEPAVGFTSYTRPTMLTYEVSGENYNSYSSSGGVAELEDGNITLTRTS